MLTSVEVRSLKAESPALPESASAIVAVLVTEGAAQLALPEAAPHPIEAGHWGIRRGSASPLLHSVTADCDGVILYFDAPADGRSAVPAGPAECRTPCHFYPMSTGAFYRSGSLDLRMREHLGVLREELVATTPLGLCRRQATAFELLSCILRALTSRQKPECRYCVHGPLREKFDAVARFLEENPGEDHSLSALSRRFFLNEFKLKEGFKAVHGKTVFEHLRKSRMDYAKMLLAGGAMTVIAVANHVGYSNPSHFARAYRMQHGQNPKNTLRQRAVATDDRGES